MDALAFTTDAAKQRRADYDYALQTMPVTYFLRQARVPTSPTSGKSSFQRPTPIHKDTRIPTGPNLWELNAPPPMKSPDRECRHPLVKCHHKW